VGDAIVIDNVRKRFRLYDERNQSLKAAIMRGRKARYSEFVALDGVTFEIAEGSTVGFIGHNGSGKSTLLKCIAKILRPDAGTIQTNGKISALLELGAGFHPELSGRENVYLNGAILGLSTKELDRRFDDIVEFSGLEPGFIDSPVKNYSSGMYVRLGFSVAINVDPDILLVDEVLAVGDEGFQQKCNEKFAELRQSGKTLVVVSHAMGAMRALCDELVWLDHGKVQMRGAAADVVDAYVSQMHDGRALDGATGNRWGSGELQVDRLELIGADGSPTNRVCTGDDVTVRLHYTAHEQIDKPVFGIAIETINGVQVTAPNSREAGVVPDQINGEGVVEWHIGRLLLLPGTYDLTVSAVDYPILHVYDFRQRALRFDVDPGTPHETFGGLVSLDGQWTVS
jgi:ABC-type polysaccharide/polyol phosphate transport system ATPase subunit